MGKSLGFRVLYPKYPLQLGTRGPIRVKLGTRKFYVDVPWIAYVFLLKYFLELNSGNSFEEIKEKLSKYEKEKLTFNNKLLCRINLYKYKYLTEGNLRLIINWNIFLEYLEQKSLKYLEEVKRADADRVGEIVSSLYRYIWGNFLLLINYIRPSKSPFDYLFSVDNKHALRLMMDFRKLLRRTGDLGEIIKLLNELENIIRYLDEVLEQRNLTDARFYTLNLIMDIYHLTMLTHRIISISAAYMLLRNILELLTRLYIYLALLKKERDNNRGDASNVLLRSLKLRVGRAKLSSISRKLNLGDSLVRLYAVCSEIIHKQPPLPFHSVLEFKFFKNFLKEYVEAVKKFVEKMINTSIKIQELEVKKTYIKKLAMEQKSIEIANNLLTMHSDSIIAFLKSVIDMMPELDIRALRILAFIFSINAPSWKKLKEGFFIEDDLYDVIRELEMLSVGLEQAIIYHSLDSLSKLKELLAQWLKEKGLVEGSRELGMKVAFYILAMILPELLM